MKRASIRRRLLGGVAAVQFAAAVLATVLVVRHERTRSYAMLDAQLVEHGAMVTSVIEAPDDPAASAILHRELLTLPKDDVYVLTDATGRVIAASRAFRLAAVQQQRQRSFVDRDVDGQRYRVMVQPGIAMFDDDPKEMARLPRLTLVYGAPVAEVEAHIRRVAWSAAGLGLAILALSLAAATLVVSSGLQPVTELAERAAEIDAMHWEWQTTAEARETVELAPLSTALTRLVERLGAAFVRERQFSADAAHEMKTGVAIVKSTLQLTLERDGEAAQLRAGVERALEDTERMQGLVSGLLQLAKIEGMRGPFLEKTVVTDVVEQIHAVLRGLEPLLQARRIAVHVEGAGPAPVRIGADDLGVVLTNLIENAIHYSPDGSVIQVAVETRTNDCEIVVRDEGCGIDAAALPHVFERFYRGDASRSRESGGAGLGLAIVQAIVQRAGGTVAVASESGAGSVFTVTLPAC